MESELTLMRTLSRDRWSHIHRQARRRVIAWSLRRVLFLPLLALAAGVGIIAAWEGFTRPVGLALSPFFAVAGLGVHGWDIVETLRGDIEIVAGEVLGRFPDEYDKATFGFETGRKREFLIEPDTSFVLTRTECVPVVGPEPRALRATRRAVKELRHADDAAVVVVNDRILERVGRLAA